ncbi:hypothetical protein Bca4012_010942 [Brassica carinata]
MTRNRFRYRSWIAITAADPSETERTGGEAGNGLGSESQRLVTWNEVQSFVLVIRICYRILYQNRMPDPALKVVSCVSVCVSGSGETRDKSLRIHFVDSVLVTFRIERFRRISNNMNKSLTENGLSKNCYRIKKKLFCAYDRWCQCQFDVGTAASRGLASFTSFCNGDIYGKQISEKKQKRILLCNKKNSDPRETTITLKHKHMKAGKHSQEIMEAGQSKRTEDELHGRVMLTFMKTMFVSSISNVSYGVVYQHERLKINLKVSVWTVVLYTRAAETFSIRNLFSISCECRKDLDCLYSKHEMRFNLPRGSEIAVGFIMVIRRQTEYELQVLISEGRT